MGLGREKDAFGKRVKRGEEGDKGGLGQEKGSFPVGSDSSKRVMPAIPAVCPMSHLSRFQPDETPGGKVWIPAGLALFPACRGGSLLNVYFRRLVII